MRLRQPSCLISMPTVKQIPPDSAKGSGGSAGRRSQRTRKAMPVSTFPLEAPTVSGEVITATATAPDWSTSEFSAGIEIQYLSVQIDVKPGS